MEQLIKGFEIMYPKFNKESLGLEDVEKICYKFEIELSFLPYKKVKGTMVRSDNRSHIYINDSLPIHQKTIIGLHEIGHYICGHTEDYHFYHSRINWDLKNEYQSSVFTAIAKTPTCILDELYGKKEPVSIKELAYEFEIPVSLMKFRLDIYNRHKGIGQLSLL